MKSFTDESGVKDEDVAIAQKRFTGSMTHRKLGGMLEALVRLPANRFSISQNKIEITR